MLALCYALDCQPDDLQMLCDARSRLEFLERRCEQLEAVIKSHGGSSCQGKCADISSKCDGIVRFCVDQICPGNNPFSRKTIDDHSQKNQIILNKVVETTEAGFVNSFPVAPGQAIRLRHLSRPGFIPKNIAIDLNLANAGTNYLDLEITFYLVGGSEPEKLGVSYQGNNFLNKDGTQIHVEWPVYKGRRVEVGFSEHVEAVIRHRGISNNLESVNVRLNHDLEEWYKLCEKYGFGDCMPDLGCR